VTSGVAAGGAEFPFGETASVPIPTPFGEFTARAFEFAGGRVHLAVAMGAIGDGRSVLTRLHSECLTGDVLSSLRCDCGVQLRSALRAVAAAGRGLVIYLTGHEGRGIGLANKLRAYAEQDGGADTVDANLSLGLPADARDYSEAAVVLAKLGVHSVRLLSNNPRKAESLQRSGIHVERLEPIATVPHLRNRCYLDVKRRRLGHLRPTGEPPADLVTAPVDVADLLGDARAHPDRPYVVVKYAQTLDGRIATATGDSKWISGEAERRASHALRASSDAVLVGAGTVAQDDPQLTVRMVPGASPLRVVLDSSLRTPPTASVLSADAGTVIVTTRDADQARRAALVAAGAVVRDVAAGPGGVSIEAALQLLRASGVASLLVEGGSRVITSLLAARLVDRLIVSISPTIVGRGVEAVGPLGITTIADGIDLRNRRTCVAGDDVLFAWDVGR
jgi:3,4-dihydroxy 2-butanone 4-phosphate synthase/GTP cyclohydrolase II